MNKSIWIVLLWAALAGRPAFAKVNGNCQSVLAMVHRTIEDFSIQPLSLSNNLSLLVLFSKHERIGSDIGEAIRVKVGRSISTLTVATPREFRDKRVLNEFETKEFVVIDNLESFVRGEDDDVNVEYVERLRASLKKRIANQRPTLILVNDPVSINRYLMRLN